MKNFKPICKISKFLCFTILILLMCTTAEGRTDILGHQSEVLTSLQQKMQKKINADFRDTPIEDVLMIIAEHAAIDIIKSPKVIGSVTAKLSNIPIEEALRNILAVNGYSYVVDENMVRIISDDEIDQSSDKFVNRIYRVTYADVKEVEKALKKFISPGGSLSSNPGTSNIIVTDIESKIKAIDTFMNEIDRVTPQILVEVRIYDITSKDRLDLGVKWNAGTNTTFDSTTGQATGGSTNPFTQGIFNSTVNKATSSNNFIRFGILNDSIDIDVLLRAEQEDICATLLANPRILVLDNEKATFQSITEIPYQELTQTSEGGDIGTTAFREVGVFLDVIPHVTRDNMVRLRVTPEFSIATGSVLVGGFLVTSPQPVVDTRRADTTLLVKSGETIVLGGLRKKETTKQINKIPFLGDLPLVGGLFKFEGEETIVSEMVVFITPRIIEHPVLTPREAENLKKTHICAPDCENTKLDPCTKTE